MQLRIGGYLAASFLLQNEPHEWDAVVILDSSLSATRFVAEHTPRHLYLRFDDVVQSAQGRRAPTVGDIEGALEFARAAKKLLVSCRAGQSRSAAVAYAVAHKFLGAEAALTLLDPCRHRPNALIVSLAASVLDDPSLATNYENWLLKLGSTRLSSHAEEIEQEIDALERAGARNLITSP